MTSSPYPPGEGRPSEPTPPLAHTDPWSPPTGGGPQGSAPFASAPQPSGPVVALIGEIAVTSSTVRTPAGDIPLAGSTWHVSDFWHNEQRTPVWAVVAAVATFCFLTVFSLLFLLVKETVYRGTVQVTVTNGARQYVARIPVTDQGQVQYVHQQVNYVRSLAAL